MAGFGSDCIEGDNEKFALFLVSLQFRQEAHKYKHRANELHDPVCSCE